jgi:hypothetical protein
MRLPVFVAGILFLASCQKPMKNEEPVTDETEVAYTGDRHCASEEVLQQQLAADPDLRQRMDAIEAITQRYVQNPQSYRLVNGQVVIPVVFNVLHRTNAQKLSNAQLQSQIDVLNADFSATNSDYNNAPSEFRAVRSGNINVRFELAAINYKSTKKTQWSTNNQMKLSAYGGIDATDPSTNLNIWVCNMGGGILGYAQFPGGAAATDGVVLDDNATGNTGTAAAPYGLGRTATHEVGHWLNLRHIWGDATCGNDLVDDTPVHTSSNGGCPAYPKTSTCGGTSHAMMTMNYMDYTYDACMYMFTLGQKNRMEATFVNGGGRNSFAQ